MVETEVRWPAELDAVSAGLIDACEAELGVIGVRASNKSWTIYGEEDSAWPVGVVHERLVLCPDRWHPFGWRWLALPYRRSLVSLVMEEIFPRWPRELLCAVLEPRLETTARAVLRPFAERLGLRLHVKVL